MMSITLPYIISISQQNLQDVLAHNSGFLGMAAGIVTGIGFLGAGIIMKTEQRVRGLTTAAIVWMTAAVGTSVVLGLISFAAFAALLVTFLLYLLRKAKLYEHIRPGQRVEPENGD